MAVISSMEDAIIVMVMVIIVNTTMATVKAQKIDTAIIIIIIIILDTTISRTKELTEDATHASMKPLAPSASAAQTRHRHQRHSWTPARTRGTSWMSWGQLWRRRIRLMLNKRAQNHLYRHHNQI